MKTRQTCVSNTAVITVSAVVLHHVKVSMMINYWSTCMTLGWVSYINESAALTVQSLGTGNMSCLYQLCVLLKRLYRHTMLGHCLPWHFGLYQRPSSEEACWLVLLPVLATIKMWCGKKPVVRVAQCVAAARVPVHRESSHFPNVTASLIHLVNLYVILCPEL